MSRRSRGTSTGSGGYPLPQRGEDVRHRAAARSSIGIDTGDVHGGAEIILCAAQLRSPDVSVAVKRNAEFMRLRKMNENASKTDQEILEMIL
jgi:hypothetical protein